MINSVILSNIIPYGEKMLKILIISLFTFTLLFSNHFFKNGDTVIDKKHKLMWQDHKDNVKVIVTHQHAIEYCEMITQSGFSDWRLPTIEEYQYIIDKSRIKDKLMIQNSFKYIKQDNYWASNRTWLRNFGRYGYYVFFKSGTIYYQNRMYPMNVRCIRDM